MKAFYKALEDIINDGNKLQQQVSTTFAKAVNRIKNEIEIEEKNRDIEERRKSAGLKTDNVISLS